ncbi:MerR family transcriptional regulator [Rhodoblastus sp.]|jgi:DNA-binding transcriptional MerR regulator|uniref:MerR family transcriptional regulator n=1 Tax=Rhodoblastus sp. TaxID=1962975 RepID=UPI0025DBD6D6|nr:MerR family transcriptional regulator [Rhodoblastus sp.]
MNASAQRQQTLPQPEYTTAELFTIGELSRIYGVTLRALRFYEQRGLLSPARKGAARFYDSTQKDRLQMILKGKHLGFTLTEISDLLDAEPGRPKADGFTLDEKMVLSQLRHLEERRADLEQAISELRATHQRLTGAAS